MSSVNLNNIYVGDNGRIQLSGGASNIDFVDTVNKLIAARRIPADNLETRIEKNDDKLTAIRDLQTLMGTLKDSMSNLYGATSFDRSRNIFEAKQIFATTDSGTPANQMIGVTATNAADTGSYTFEVDRLATRNKISSNSQTLTPGESATDTIGTGKFTITGGSGSAQFTVNDGDSLQDIRDRVNSLKDSTGVQASIVKVSATESTLIFTATAEGEDNRISFSDDDGGMVLQNLGVLSDPTTTNAANVIDEGLNAQLTLDGITVERSSNEFSDLIDGLNISLFDAEPGTKITIEIEQDLNQAKQAIIDFVDAYNAVQGFINEKTFVDPVTGEASEDAILLGNTTVKNIESSLQQIAGSFAKGVTDRANRDDYNVLAQIGIDFVAFGSNEDPLQDKTLRIDESKLDDALVNNPTEVMELFQFRGKSDTSDVQVTGFNGKTSAGQYSFNIEASGGKITGVTYDVYDPDGNVVATGKRATFNGTSITTPDGLRLFYAGDGNSNSTANVTTSQGIGAQLYFELDSFVDSNDGTLSQEITALETENTSYQDKIDRIDERLARQRESLMDRFISMESAIARLKNIQNSLSEITAAGRENN